MESTSQEWCPWTLYRYAYLIGLALHLCWHHNEEISHSPAPHPQDFPVDRKCKESGSFVPYKWKICGCSKALQCLIPSFQGTTVMRVTKKFPLKNVNSLHQNLKLWKAYTIMHNVQWPLVNQAVKMYCFYHLIILKNRKECGDNKPMAQCQDRDTSHAE